MGPARRYSVGENRRRAPPSRTTCFGGTPTPDTTTDVFVAAYRDVDAATSDFDTFVSGVRAKRVRRHGRLHRSPGRNPVYTSPAALA